MLFYFPKRYPDELLYSWIARYQKHIGISSPKQIQKELFGVVNNAAVVDFPSNLAELTKRLANVIPDISIDYIVYKTTLLPYFQPFSNPNRLIQARKHMASDYGGSIHTSLGLSASRINFFHNLKACPKCMEDHFLKYDECYWQRLFQLPSVWVCDIHQVPLVSTEVTFHPTNKHQFISTPDNIQSRPLWSESLIQRNWGKVMLLTRDSRFLLENVIPSITNELWQTRYFFLLQKNGLIKGKQHVYQNILKERLIEFWGLGFLEFLNCDVTKVKEDTWLNKLTRKLRTNFHPLLHLLLYRALEGSEAPIDNLFLLRTHKKEEPVNSGALKADAKILDAKKKEWMSLINENPSIGITGLRKLNPSLYTWIYRQNQKWLKQHSPKLHKSGNNSEGRVNWQHRDYVLCKQLLGKAHSLTSDKNAPRITKTLLIASIGKQALVEKNKVKLPLCYLVFDRYTESISKYQCRRVWLAYRVLLKENELVLAWKLYRRAAIRKNASQEVHQLILRLERMNARNVNITNEIHPKATTKKQAS